MADREKCFSCCGRKWVAWAGGELPLRLCMAIPPWVVASYCPRCSGSGFDPESDRYRTEASE